MDSCGEQIGLRSRLLFLFQIGRMCAKSLSTKPESLSPSRWPCQCQCHCHCHCHCDPHQHPNRHHHHHAVTHFFLAANRSWNQGGSMAQMQFGTAIVVICPTSIHHHRSVGHSTSSSSLSHTNADNSIIMSTIHAHTTPSTIVSTHPNRSQPCLCCLVLQPHSAAISTSSSTTPSGISHRCESIVHSSSSSIQIQCFIHSPAAASSTISTTLWPSSSIPSSRQWSSPALLHPTSTSTSDTASC